MSKQTRVLSPIYSFLPTEVEGFDSLAELALDMRWSWNHATDEVWRQLDPELWEITHNPWVVLQMVSRDRLVSMLADATFRNNVDDLVQTRRQVLEAPAWFQQNHAQGSLTCVAYFSMEFMLSEALPIYSGGLGNVAGDQLKASSDLGVPVVGVGLLYQQGYFRQVINQNGEQAQTYPYNDPGPAADNTFAPSQRRVVAAGDHIAGIPRMAACVAGSSRQSKALPNRQQRSGKLSGPPWNHERALRRRA